MKAWKLLLPIPFVFALAMVPQDPAADAESAMILSISDFQYVTLQGTVTTVPAKNVVEIRYLEDHNEHIRLELVYDNGDYSMIDAQGFHVLRSGSSMREVKILRSKRSRLRFPKLP